MRFCGEPQAVPFLVYFASELLPNIFRNIVCERPHRVVVNKAWIGDVISIIRDMSAVAHDMNDGGFSTLGAKELLRELNAARVVA